MTLWRAVYPILMYYAIMVLVSTIFSMVLLRSGVEYEAYTKMALWATAVAGFFTIPIALWLIIQDKRKGYVTYLQKGSMNGRSIIWMIFLGPSVSFLLNILMSLLNLFQLFPGYNEDVSPVIYSNSFAVSVFCGAIVAPVIEELIFRGLLYSRIRNRWGVVWGIVASSLLFGIFHGNVVQFIYASILGMVFALFVEYFQSLGASILLHITANAWSFLCTYYTGILKNGTIVMLMLLFQIIIVAGSMIAVLQKRGR